MKAIATHENVYSSTPHYTTVGKKLIHSKNNEKENKHSDLGLGLESLPTLLLQQDQRSKSVLTGFLRDDALRIF